MDEKKLDELVDEIANALSSLSMRYLAPSAELLQKRLIQKLNERNFVTEAIKSPTGKPMIKISNVPEHGQAWIHIGDVAPDGRFRVRYTVDEEYFLRMKSQFSCSLCQKPILY